MEEEWCSDHGCAETWMLFVQRGLLTPGVHGFLIVRELFVFISKTTVMDCSIMFQNFRQLSWNREVPLFKEASELSSLKPQLDQLGIPLYAVVKEKIGTEVEDFQHYFKGEIFLDEKKKFYGPHKRKMLLMGFIRLGVWQNFLRAWKNGYSGNLEGEGFILGGVYVIGAGKQGVLLEHREREFGDKVILQSVLDAAEKIKPQAADTE
ncbi:peroxiredoxin-like 2A isoform X4 [Chelonia mydas]|uniref:peroxiredoxin-like 2A isoform X4 n=1 Tax=Chelonia mydas TaxID=8469 RepID=UPI0018A238CF|nr:peroxiredoxin-like 2A isoform X4 [Chelonia mydas]